MLSFSEHRFKIEDVSLALNDAYIITEGNFFQKAFKDF